MCNNKNHFIVTKKKKKIHKRILFVKLKYNTGIQKKNTGITVQKYCLHETRIQNKTE